MRANIRLDVTLEELCAILAGRRLSECVVSREPTPTRVGGQVVYSVSRARDALAWVLGRCGIGPGDEVLITDLMCETAGHAVRRTGARLVTYGLDPGSFRPSVEACGRAISERTKALIVPHLYGVRTDLADFAALAESHDLLLIEDSALVFPAGENALQDYETPAACVLYSFNYGKPLSVGWGGAVSLSAFLADRVGPPSVVTMDEDDDRFYAAALLLGYVMTGRARPREACIQADAGLHLLAMKGGGRRLAVPDRRAVDALFEAAGRGPDAVLAWCDTRAPRVWALRGSHVLSDAGGLFARVHARVAGRLSDLGRGVGGIDDGPMESLRTGGYCEALLAAQRRTLCEELINGHRQAMADFYAPNLDGGRWVLPGPGEAAYWLSYPVAAKRPLRRNRLVRRVAERLAVDVYPYVWPDVLHRVPSLQRAVKEGPGSAESARLVDGLLNLPVHGELPLEEASKLVALLNGWR